MPNPFYVAPIDPGWGRVGEALAAGITGGISGFLRARQARQEEAERARREAIEAEERARRQAMAEAQFNAWLAERGGGRGPRPTRVIDTRIAKALGAPSPSIETSAIGPTGEPIRLMNSIQRPPRTFQTRVPDERYVEVLPDRPGMPGAYVASPEYLRTQRILDALAAEAPRVGVDPTPFISGPEPDIAGLRAALADAYARQASNQAAGRPALWEIERTERMIAWPIAQYVYETVASVDPRPPGPADRPFFIDEARKAVRQAGLPETLVPVVVDMIYDAYGNYQTPLQTGVGPEMKAVADLIEEFGSSVEGALFGVTGRPPQALVDSWLSGRGQLALRAIATRYGLDPVQVESLFREQLGAK